MPKRSRTMTVFQQADYLFDAANREALAGRLMGLAARHSDADHHFQRAAKYEEQARMVLDQVMSNSKSSPIESADNSVGLCVFPPAACGSPAPKLHGCPVMEPQLIKSFQAIGEDGREVQVNSWQTYRHNSRGASGGDEWIPETKHVLKTGDGLEVLQESEAGDLLRIQSTGERLTRVRS